MKRVLFRSLNPLASLIFLSACSFHDSTQAATDFNDVGKAITLRMQNMHYDRKAIDEKLSQKILETYLRSLDPARLFFTQQDVNAFKREYGNNLQDYLIGGQAMEPAQKINELYVKRAKEMVAHSRQLLKDSSFNFERNAYIERQRKEANWAKDTTQLQQLWSDRLEEQLLSEILRREALAKLAKQQNKPDPSLEEKSPQQKLDLRFQRILRTIEEIDSEEVADMFFSAITQSYDPHSDYMGAREMQRFNSAMSGSLIGVGALLQAEDDGATKIAGVVVGGPIDKSGEIKLNDRIVAVDKDNSGNMIDIMFMPIDKVVELIRGKEGSQVRLKVESAKTPGQAKIVTLKRQKVEMKDELVKGEVIDYTNDAGKQVKLGVITLPSFYADFETGSRRCARDVLEILARMIKENVAGIVIDLRGNGGGSLEEVRVMTGFFTGSGPVVQIKSTGGRVDKLESGMSKPLFNGPIVVMTNKLSASASEILAAALQDYGRAVIVGQDSTFGKGTVQKPYDIGKDLPFFADQSKAGLLKLTVQKFYRVAGGSTQLRGVVPDIHLPSLVDAFEIGENKLPSPMPYDEIAPAKGYRQQNDIKNMLPELSKRSQQRQLKDYDFEVVRQDIEFAKKQLAENKLSLNKLERTKENDNQEQRRQQINAERKKRYEELAKQDSQNLKVYRLTLDNAKQPGPLPLADKEKDEQSNMKTAKDAIDNLDDTPDYPSNLDPEKREVLAILSDMLSLQKKS